MPFVLNLETDAKLLYFYEHWFDLEPTKTIVEPSCAWYRPWLWPDNSVVGFFDHIYWLKCYVIEATPIALASADQ